jgi:replicative DNA helicase
MLRNDHMKRKAERALATSVEALKDTKPDDILQFVSAVQGDLLKVVESKEGDDTPMGDLALSMIEGWECTRPETLINWPLPSLRKYIASLTDELVFIVAQESVGKTALALQICNEISRSLGKVTSYNSLETAKKRLVKRLLQQEMHYRKKLYKIDDLTRKDANPLDRTDAKTLSLRLNDLPIRFSDAPMTLEQIHSWARREKSNGSRLLVVDNMRHIQESKKYNSLTEKFQDFSLRLKWIRDDVKLPVVVLHHASYGKEGDKMDVGWAKDIKKDADILIYMKRGKDVNVDSETQDVEIIVDKNRDGRRGFSIETHLVLASQIFREIINGVPHTYEEPTYEDGL